MAAETRIALEGAEFCRGDRVVVPDAFETLFGAESDFRHRALRARLLPDGCASRRRDSRRFDACERELEENLECEGEGAAAADEIARLAEIGL
jgi:hypothetical protein